MIDRRRERKRERERLSPSISFGKRNPVMPIKDFEIELNWKWRNLQMDRFKEMRWRRTERARKSRKR